jgi:hypothetical protein
MRDIVTITDLTRMQEQRVCIAGYLPNGMCVRPVFRSGGISEEWLKVSGQGVIRPFAKVEFDLIENKSQPPHTEDWIIDPRYRVNRGLLSTSEQKILLAKTECISVESIFETNVYREPGWYVKFGEGKHSLGTIKPVRIYEVSYKLLDTGKWDYRIAFIDQNKERYRLAVTDIAFRYIFDASRSYKKIQPDEMAKRVTRILQNAQVFLRIGLARGWEKFPERCYLQITGVYSFPDYLYGYCFSDISCSIDEIIELMRVEENTPF